MIAEHFGYLTPITTTSAVSWTEQVTLNAWCVSLSVHTDVIWVILSVEVGGLLGVTQQLSCFETEFNTQPHRNIEGDFNPFASPQKSKHDARDDNNFKEPGGAWEGRQDAIQQDENGLSHNAVNRASNGLQSNLSVVTYSQVCMNE